MTVHVFHVKSTFLNFHVSMHAQHLCINQKQCISIHKLLCIDTSELFFFFWLWLSENCVQEKCFT